MRLRCSCPDPECDRQRVPPGGGNKVSFRAILCCWQTHSACIPLPRVNGSCVWSHVTRRLVWTSLQPVVTYSTRRAPPAARCPVTARPAHPRRRRTGPSSEPHLRSPRPPSGATCPWPLPHLCHKLTGTRRVGIMPPRFHSSRFVGSFNRGLVSAAGGPF